MRRRRETRHLGLEGGGGDDHGAATEAEVGEEEGLELSEGFVCAGLAGEEDGMGATVASVDGFDEWGDGLQLVGAEGARRVEGAGEGRDVCCEAAEGGSASE